MDISLTPEFERAFRQFLVDSKIATYASVSPQKKDLADGGVELEFSQGKFLYRDRYYGGILFHGQEVVFQENKPKWSMVYHGYTPDAEEPSPNVIYLLKAALRDVPVEAPYRGPSTRTHGDLVYSCQVSGSLGRFDGEEVIKRGDELLLRLIFAGGWIK